MHPNIKLESLTNSLIIYYGKVKMVDRAIKTYHQMDDHGTPGTVTSFNALLTTCREAGEFNKLIEMVKNRYALNMSSSWAKLEAELGLCKSN
ncbi:hypothetical protein AMTR_s00012p00200050 [Amborella trichopoda]|uniref:Pentacotripeptide-repeat region of PRORP domain-containing protein n=1 Tax=Amborella trichopoda TaxID=13333 RepID=W1PJC1_AMBTC|nr:hypothetical protein AMTR_s00012p00200050 [Amborella trichopoda]